MLTRLAIAILLVLMSLGSGAQAQTLDLTASGIAAQGPAPDRIQLAQQRRSLFDFLFGPSEPERAPPAEVAPQRQAAPAAPAPVTVNTVDKNEGATRLAVIGDSMAVDLARALDRFYAEDPDLEIVSMGVGSSGFVRDDFYDWQNALETAIAEDSFDLAVVIIGINDRQQIITSDGARADPLTDPYKTEYSARVTDFVSALRAAGKPAIWVGLPPMRANSYSSAIAQISSLQRTASFSGGAEFVDIYERFVNEAGNYTDTGPDLKGQMATMRKSDGIHFAAAGADKVAFFVDKAIRLFYRGGTLSLAVADPLAGSDAVNMLRPPFQGLGQARLLEVAGAVLSLNESPRAFGDLLVAGDAEPSQPFALTDLVTAPVGRVDAFGSGVDPDLLVDLPEEPEVQGPVLPPPS